MKHQEGTFKGVRDAYSHRLLRRDRRSRDGLWVGVPSHRRRHRHPLSHALRRGVGAGHCWMGAFDEGQVGEILSIPSQIRVVASLPVGYPQDPAPVEKTRLPFEKITYERG